MMATDPKTTLETLAGALSTQSFHGEHPEVALHWARKIWEPAYLEGFAEGMMACGHVFAGHLDSYEKLRDKMLDIKRGSK